MNDRSSRLWTILVILVTVLGSRVPAQAQFFSGSFVLDNDKAFFPFTSNGDVTTIRSLGAEGGTSMYGPAVPSGGFDPIISLFDSAGQFLTYSDDSFGLDSNLSVPLPAGNYTAVLTQYYNYPNGPTLADGFYEDSDPNFAGGFNGLTPNWAVDISHTARHTIADAKAAPLGSLVTIDGVVISNNIDLISSSSVASVQVQDATGGLTVFGSNAAISGPFGSLPDGYLITIRGTTSSFSGLFELTNPVVQAYHFLTDAPTPTTVSATDLQDGSGIAESLESALVQLPNVQFLGIVPGQTFAALTNYLVSDGITTTVVRLPTDAIGLTGQPIPTGPVSIRGVLSQFDSTSPFTSGYELLLTRPSDIVAVPEPATLAMIATGLATWIVSSSRRRRGSRASAIVQKPQCVCIS